MCLFLCASRVLGVIWVSGWVCVGPASLDLPDTIQWEGDMAWLEKRGKRYRISLDFNGRHISRALKTGNKREAETILVRLEDNLRLIERGVLQLPPDADLMSFLISDGKLANRITIEKPLTIAELFQRYHAEMLEGVKETSTRYTEKIHTAHLQRLIGGSTPVRSVTTEVLQTYVNTRALEKGRREQPVSHQTIRKEVGTFVSIWNRFAVPLGLVSGRAPTCGLAYRKTKGKPPFQTWEQIERQINRGGISAERLEDLWDSLFLTLPQIDELLQFVRGNCRHRCIFPMFAIAAHTGARRSEILRSNIDDFDFGSGTVIIREKKRDRSKDLTFRTVPMSPLLEEVMREWFLEHPGGHLTICQEENEPLTFQFAAHHFHCALEGSKWEKLRGYHVFRHSFASNCALKGVDQRILDAWLEQAPPARLPLITVPLAYPALVSFSLAAPSPSLPSFSFAFFACSCFACSSR